MTGDGHHEGNAAGPEGGRAPLVVLVKLWGGPGLDMGVDMCTVLLLLEQG